MKKEYLLLAVIIIFAAFLRLWQLGVVPVGVTHDELGYIYNSYSISQTGKNVFGEFLPFLTWMNKGGWPFLPVPIYFSVPFFWLFGLSATTGRLLPALLGIFDVLLIYILIKQIFNKTPFALLSAFFLAISPWHLHFSRSAYDPNYALFFYLLSIVVFIYEVRNKRLPIFSFIAILFAVFSYRAMNALFPSLIILLIWYGVRVLKINKIQLLTFLSGICFIVLSLIFIIALYGKAYTAEAQLWSDSKMQEDIDAQIRQAQGPLFVRRFFLNKPAYIVNKLRENYVKAYSPEFLFLYTEPSKIYSIWSRGRIYFIDIVFIILGIAYLFKVNKKAAILIVSFVLIGGLPGMIGGMPYSARNFFISAFLPILSAAGVLFLLDKATIGKIRIVVIFLTILVYAYVFGSYVFDYYGRYTLYGGEAWAKSLKDMSFEVMENRQKYNKIIIGTSSFGDIMQYAFYAKLNPLAIQNAWKQRKKDKFSIENVTFISGCLGDQEVNISTLYIVHENCNKYLVPNSLIKDYPGNTVWKIYKNVHGL